MTEKVVFQCSSRKHENLWTYEGQRIEFVAQPEQCGGSTGFLYSRPDDLIPNTNKTWRRELEDYSRRHSGTGDNPDDLLKAWELYKPKEYGLLVSRFGYKNVFILSAGWGLTRSDFLLPHYDITFSRRAKEAYKKRKKTDTYSDFNHLAKDIEQSDTIYFFGCNDYLPLYYHLTRDLPGTKIIFHKSEKPPQERGYKYCKYVTTQSQNWHYPCVRDFIDGKLR